MPLPTGILTGIANSPAVTAGTQEAAGGFLSFLGTTISAGLEGGVNYLSALSQINLLERINSAGLSNTAINTATTTATTNLAAVGAGGSGFLADLPSWVVPAGIGGIAFIAVLLLIKK
ncbi:MAG: hypothetical protein JKY60_20635 [Kordiimonadaceae bacterium]|nr:hypothetical protein [Kordiimonadaceae bacterium]